MRLAAAFFILAGAGHCEKVMPAGKWYAALQKLGAKFPRGATTAERDKNRADFVDALERALDGRTITWSGTVRNVKWKGGIAEVAAYSSREIAKIADNKTDTVRVSGPTPFKLVASQDEAMRIKPGMLLKFKASVVFQRGMPDPILGTVGKQRLFMFTHRGNGGIAGVITTTDYQVKIENRSFWGRWDGAVER